MKNAASTVAGLLLFADLDRAAALRCFNIVQAYLLVCRDEGEKPAAIVLEYLDKPRGRNWLAAADWLLSFDPRSYLDRFRRDDDQPEDHVIDGTPDPLLPES